MSPGTREIVVSVFAVLLVIISGALARKRHILNEAADKTLLALIINVLLPCLILDAILGNAALREINKVIAPPAIGFLCVTIGLLVGLAIARLPQALTGLDDRREKRTFAFCVGIHNYGYIPLPLVGQLYGDEAVGVLLIHNIGVELAFWTIGLVILTGGLRGQWWKRLINPPLISVIVAVILNATGLFDPPAIDAHAPATAFAQTLDMITSALRTAFATIGSMAIPLGLLLIGATMADLIEVPGRQTKLRLHAWARTLTWAVALRLAVIPASFLVIASVLPLSLELKQVLIVEAAMPAAVFPVIMARHYDGDPPTALRIILATSAVSVLTIVPWINFGSDLLGIAPAP